MNAFASTMAPGWDAFQRDALAELGLRSYVLAQTQGAEVGGRVEIASPALQEALVRAAGGAREALDVVAGLAQSPASAQGKRLAWPHLRRMRARAQ